MSENGDPTPIRPGIENQSEDGPIPIRPGVYVNRPQNLGRRNLFKKLAGIAAILGFGGAAVASQTETGKKIMNALPGQATSTSRPSLEQQKKEVEKNINSQQKPALSEIDPTQQQIQSNIKATMDADPNNRYQNPSPSPSPEKK